MSRFNAMMVRHFRDLPVVYTCADVYRNRTIQVFDIKEDNLVGISDGVDAWVASQSQVLDGHLLGHYIKNPQTGGKSHVTKPATRVALKDANPQNHPVKAGRVRLLV